MPWYCHACNVYQNRDTAGQKAGQVQARAMAATMPCRSVDRFHMRTYVIVAGMFFCIYFYSCLLHMSVHADYKSVWYALAGSRQTSFHRQVRTSDAAAASTQHPASSTPPTAARCTSHAARSPWMKHADSRHGCPFFPHHATTSAAPEDDDNGDMYV